MITSNDMYMAASFLKWQWGVSKRNVKWRINYGDDLINKLP